MGMGLNYAEVVPFIAYKHMLVDTHTYSYSHYVI